MPESSDPTHPAYLDEAEVRQELTRVFDVCTGCRACLPLCGVFPTLVELVERHPDREAGRLTPAQQDRVVDQCYHCDRCVTACPYAPDRHELAVDVPRLVLRAVAMRKATGQLGGRRRVTAVLAGRVDVVGRLATRAAPVANRVVGATPGSLVRRAVELTTGVSAVRVLPTYARQRFSTWFRRRPRVRLTNRQGRVAVYPTCLVEYHEPAIGHALVRVFERNGIECSLAAGVGCCGLPVLQGGDVERFADMARANVKALAAVVQSGKEIVTAQPACTAVIRREYPAHVGGAAASMVADHTSDAVEYLMRIHRSDRSALDIDFAGDRPARITYHVPCHLRSVADGLPSRDLLRLTGARVTPVQRCSAMEGMWGLRSGNTDVAVPVAAALGDEIRRAGGDVVVGDCHLANTAIAEQTGTAPLHPLQVLARAYGIPPEQP